MSIQRLDHVNVVTARLGEMVMFYEVVLGLKPGPRPDFPFPGAWLYAGDHPVVHLVGSDAPDRVGSEVGLKLEHFAFSATDMAAFEEKLIRLGYPFKKSNVPGAGLIQFHIADPDGNHVHIDFEVTG